MPCTKSRYCIRFIVDITLLLSVVITIVLVKKLWPPFLRGMYCYDESLTYPYKDNDTISDSLLLFYGVAIPVNVRGFYCEDESIRYPYKNSTISTRVLYLVGFILPISVMCLVEFLRARRENIGKEFRLFGRKFSSWLWAIYSTVGVFLFGCACSQLFTDIAKYSLGILRPHFIEVCQPDWSKTNCSVNELEYVDPIPCTTDDLVNLKDARLSFPSGHASFSTFTMLYLVAYLQARLRINGFRLARPVLQLMCLLLNFYTCLTRISDYKHHWPDVVGGFLLGGTVALLVVFFVSDLFTERKPKVTKNAVVMLQDYQTATDEPHTNAHNP